MLLPMISVEPSTRLLKVPAIGVAAMLLMTVKTVPSVSVPDAKIAKRKRRRR